MSQAYFASISASGPIRYNQYPFAIGVLEAPDNFMPIGKALQIGPTEGGLAIWRLTIRAQHNSGICSVRTANHELHVPQVLRLATLRFHAGLLSPGDRTR